MPQIVNEKQKLWNEKYAELKSKLNEFKEKEQVLLNKSGSDREEAFKNLTLAGIALNMTSIFVLMDSVSRELLGTKSDNYLNEARKLCYKILMYLEAVVTPHVDVPFSEYEEKLNLIENFSDAKRLKMVRMIGFTITSVEDGFGEKSKWRWSFVEIRGRFAVIAKNLINLKQYIANSDPRIEGYQERIALMLRVKDLLQQSADGYREKYELSTRRIDDMKAAIDILNSLRRIHLALAENEKAESLKKKIDIWKFKMDNDMKAQEQQKAVEKKQDTASNFLGKFKK
ncbi:MAG: hypothetical protein JXR63_04595 [Spirochaetales bacterium]|nr:hypothetical protein [Spirochaetales bacterium]